MLIKRVAAVLATVALTALLTAMSSLPSVFSWSGATWCPTYQEQYGCSNTQHSRQYTVAYAPKQVSRVNGQIRLTMDYPQHLSGAFNGEGHFAVSPRQWVWARVYLPCVNGKVANWPAFWLDGWDNTTARNRGEIDVVEGLGGRAKWHYHYVNAAGRLAQVGGAVAGNFCGWHSYGVWRGTDVVRFRYDGKVVGKVTSAELKVPLPSNPMYVIFDNGAGQWGGPLSPHARMIVSHFSRG